MKRMVCVILAMLMLFSLSACGNSGVPDGAEALSPEQTATPQGSEKETAAGTKETELHFAEDYGEIYSVLLSRRENELVVRNGLAVDTMTDEAVPESSESSGTNYGADFSGTNVQVAGIDEGDIVKTDGEYIYVLRGGDELVILKAGGVYTRVVGRIDLNAQSLSATPLKDGDSYSHSDKSAREIFICGDTLAVIYEYWSWSEFRKNDIWSYESENRTIVELYDVSDPASAGLVATLGQDGSIMGTRLYEGRLYIISSWNDYSLENADIRKIEDVIPALYSGQARMPIEANDICICPHGTSTGYVVAAVYDLEKAEALSCQCVLGGGSNVYMSGENIYVAGRAYSDGAGQPRTEGVYTVVDYAPATNTSVCRFAVTESGLELRAQGIVPGYIESQFSLDEHEGYIRLVTTTNGGSYTVYNDEERGFVNYVWHEDIPETNALYILDQSLNMVGSVEDLAEGERVYSARFDGDIAYFCTFEQVDPLFAVDCSDPKAPKVLSALKISGFSEYLHSWSEDLLFGFGYEANEETGWTQGLKMVMFDTSDKTNVTAASSLSLEDCRYSEALYDHHAFFISPENNIIGFVGDGDYYIFGYSAEEGFFERAHFSYRSWDHSVRGFHIGGEIYLIGRDGGYVLDLEDCSLIKNLDW